MRELITTLRENKIHISLENENLKIKFDGENIPEYILEEIRKNKFNLISFLKENVKVENIYRPLLQASKRESYPLTPSQNRFWILSQLEDGSVANDIHNAIRLNGLIEVNKFEECFRLLIERHEILRTYFGTTSEGVIQQYIMPIEELDFRLTHRDYSLEVNPEQCVVDYLQDINREAFDLEQAPLIRGSLIKLKEDAYVFFLSMHHIVGDGWSIQLLISEIIKNYNGLIQEKEIDLPVLNIQYKDYAVWLSEELQQKKQKESEQYWLNQFSGDLPVLDLPSSKARPLVQTYNGETIRHEFSKSFLDKLKTFSKSQDATLFMTLISGINALLYRYSGQDDIIIGTPIAGRVHPDLENQLGLYLNTLAIRTKFKEENSFLDLIAAQKETLLGAYEHQGYPFDALVGKLNLKRDMSRSALFDVMVVLQNQGQLTSINSNEGLIDLEVSNYSFENRTSQFDMSFTFVESEGLYLAIEYNTDIYASYLIERMFLHFENLLSELIEDPKINIQDVGYITETEKHQLLFDFNSTEVAYPKDKTIVDLFEDQVARTPDNIAVVFEDQVLMYQELNEKSNQLAHYLREKGVKSNTHVFFFLERGIDYLVCMLGVWKVGGHFTPLDINFPTERNKGILQQAKDFFILSSNDYLLQVEALGDNVDYLIFEAAYCENYDKDNLGLVLEIKSLAYIIFTSGSTGVPKGAMVEHFGMVNHLFAKITDFEISDKDNVGQTATHIFDVSIWQFMTALIVGGKTTILIGEDAWNPEKIFQCIDNNSITILESVPAHFSILLDFLSRESVLPLLRSLRYLIMNGESLPVEYCKKWFEYYPSIPMANVYGPTECSDDITHYIFKECSENWRGSVPIGKPIQNMSIYILDNHLNLLPHGTAGDLYVSGIGVGQGYLNDIEKTQLAFVRNPFFREGSLNHSEKLYKTGDLAKWHADGILEFIGRKDDQVKINGIRIELGEIENVLHQCPLVSQSVLLISTDENKNKNLTAYIVSNGVFSPKEIQNYMKEHLPDYMVPSLYVEIDAVPLTPNGKVDRKALPEVSASDLLRREFVGPRNDLEKNLVSIWEEVLGISSIGITDNFFELGGHSLMVAQVINRINKQLGKTISFKAFFNNPSILDLSGELTVNEYVSIPKAAEMLSYPATASQSRLWILSQLEGGSLAYNMMAAVTLKGALQANKLEDCLSIMIERHEILRTSFKINEEGEVRQHIIPADELDFRIDLQDYSSEPDSTEMVSDYLLQKNQLPFDLENPPLIRGSLVKLKEDEHVFFLSMHHIIGDGWSIQLLISEIVQIYNGLVQEKNVDLPVLNIQYKDYAVWLNEEIQQEKLQESEQYWLNQFRGQLPVLDLPSFKLRPVVKTFNGAAIRHEFSKRFLDKLKSFSKAHDATLFMTLVAGINALLYRYSGQDDIIIGTPIAGREHPDVENQLGLYLNTLAIRTRFKEQNSFLDVIVHEKETLLEAFEYQGYPFDVLFGKLNLKRDSSRSALFDVMVVLQNQDQLQNLKEREEFINLKATYFDLKSTTSQFDMCFTFVENEKLDLIIDYNTDLYDSCFIERMFSHLEIFVTKLIDRPEVNIEEISYLTEAEKVELLIDFNSTAADYPKEKTIVDLFEEQVDKTPDNIAVLFEEIELTYYKLNELANQFGHYLRENYSIEPNDLIGIKLDRSELMIIAILGVLKSGGAYVPIDLNYPEQRIAYIEKDIDSKIIIDNTALAQFFEAQNSYSKTNISKINQVSDSAYVIYTSGTTGNPKGVIIKHSNVVRLLKTDKLLFDFKEDDVWTMFHSYCFDFSVWEMYGALFNGSKLIIISSDIAKDPMAFLNVMIKEKVTVLNQTPSNFYNLLFEELKRPLHNLSLRFVIFGGEALNSQKLLDYAERYPMTKLVNMYGITETTVHVTYKEITVDEMNSNASNIGVPIPTMSCYVLDQNENLQPIGVPGELYVGGEGLAKGYLNKDDLTREKFIQSPFVSGEILYRSGDIVKMRENGELEYLGRKDHQIKIRGFRIELGEIESTILEYSDNISQVVVEIKMVNEENALAAYVVGDDIDKSLLRVFLESKLPDYMVPSFYAAIPQIPLTSNGKIDRKALPEISQEDLIRREYIKARSLTEEKLVLIWENVLGISSIGVTDNFFELGGNSLQIMRVLNLISNEFEIRLGIGDLIIKPTIENAASIIQELLSLSIMQKRKSKTII
ncbi:amino acid adenylation domain-containing protein [Flavobacterium sp. ZT3R18]|uniref:non-ribosomal peptide synthetase n=1 Tax=Flavobacterium sp. ZT3R18 TaxID=2594429 RepID=UPI00117A3434|nr:non-ribosomal peptide synthetase [Flavobacterium sp. ZT3R18]TRX33014.1 amino acid adenylation domain-containing protein [Flavobacterium sp. ZT3R18]